MAVTIRYFGQEFTLDGRTARGGQAWLRKLFESYTEDPREYPPVTVEQWWAYELEDALGVEIVDLGPEPEFDPNVKY